MSKADIPWVVAKDKKRRRNRDTEEMRCKCGNRLLRILKEPIRRKERTLKAPDLRIAAECPLCGNDARIVRGSSN